MLKKLFLMVLCSSYLTAEIAPLPEEFYVNERYFSLTTTFDIETKTEYLGTVHRKIFSLTPEYHLNDPMGNSLAKARMRFWSFNVVFDVVDGQDLPLGTVNQNFSVFLPSFEIVSPDFKKLANAKLNFWGTTWDLTDPLTDRTIATLSRSLFSLKNNWKVTLLDPEQIYQKKIHPHLLITLMAFQVDREYWEAISSVQQIKNRASLESDSFEGITAGRYSEILESYRPLILSVEPDEQDFIFVEALPEKCRYLKTVDPLKGFDSTLSYLFNELASDHLTLGQRSALFMMLEQKLEEVK